MAVLRVPGLGLPPLSLAPDTSAGRPGAILGYPENGPWRCAPAASARRRRCSPRTPTDDGPVSRLLTPLRGVVRPGNSGGPLVDPQGEVLTTVFAGTTGAGPAGGYGVANATVARVLAGARGGWATGGAGLSRHRPVRCDLSRANR